MDPTPLLSDTIYNRLKWIVQIFLPAFASLYFGLANIYGWSNAENVVGTTALLTTFLGILLGISTRQYNSQNMADGQIVISATDEPETKSFSLRLEKSPGELEAMNRVSFRVVHEE